MSDEEPPNHTEDGAESDDTGDLPPPSTWAGRARKEEQERAEAANVSHGMTEESEGLAAADDEAVRSEADEQEDPPDEFEFEKDLDEILAEPDEDEAVPSKDEAALDEEDPDAGADPDEEEARPLASGVTVEANTLLLSDAEAAREAAHAGLTKRAKKSSFSHDVTTGSHRVQPATKAPAIPAAARGEAEEGAGAPPKRRLGWRFVAAAFVIVSSMAAATAVSFLLFLSDIAEGLNDDGQLAAARAQLDTVDGGAPQTILVLGSDKRSGTPGDPGRSDTAMLLRVDPDKNFLALMSLPRDLEVPIPGYGTDKLNAAYSYGEQAKPGDGPVLAIRTIKDYLGIPINHVVNVDFEGFYEAVNAIDCVYIDSDRHYFNSNEGLFGDQLYAEIDVEAGYQKLCGYKALQYVRYRHEDSDLVRGTRQQEFVREARARIPPRELLPLFGTGNELIDIFTKNTSSDINDAGTIVAMMKTFLSVREAPVRQVSIGEITESGGVDATDEQIKSSVNQFLGNDLDEAPAEEPTDPDTKPSESNGDEKKPTEPKPEPDAGLIDSAAAGQQIAAGFKVLDKRDADLPIFYPTKIVGTPDAAISAEDSRAAPLAPPEDEKEVYEMYKFVMTHVDPNVGTTYYGISGTNWLEPPILKNESEIRTIDGRDYLLYFEQDELRMVAWQTSKGSYWVTNTLSRALTEDQMLGVATSARELGQ